MQHKQFQHRCLIFELAKLVAVIKPFKYLRQISVTFTPSRLMHFTKNVND